MAEFLWTVGATLVVMLIVFAALAFGYLAGRKRDKCACAAANRVMHKIETQKKIARQAKKYDPKTVDPHELPVLPDSIVDS